MNFINHTYKDKGIVEPIAATLANVDGMDKVFYDSWSIQPGDGIIDKMNDGLNQCRYFFFFVSKNSLESKMVEVEYKNLKMYVEKFIVLIGVLRQVSQSQ